MVVFITTCQCHSLIYTFIFILYFMCLLLKYVARTTVLLELCKNLHTTNANESPKHLPTNPQILETGVTMSVLEFNYGSRGIRLIYF